MNTLHGDTLRDLAFDHRAGLRREMADRRLAAQAQVDRTATATGADVAPVTPKVSGWSGRLPSFGRRARSF